MAIDTTMLASVGLEVGKGIRDDLVAGIHELADAITAEDKQVLMTAAEQLGELVGRGYAGEDVSADLAIVKGTIAQYKDLGAQLLKRVSKEKLESIGLRLLGGVVKVGETVLKGFIPI